jgi:hypothetical protein
MRIKFFDPFTSLGWRLTGNGGIASAIPGITPTEGPQFAWIDTQSEPAANGPLGAFGSTLLSAPFEIAAGQALSLDLNFLSNDGGNRNDYAYVQLAACPGTLTLTLYSAGAGNGPLAAVPAPPECPAPAISTGVILNPLTANFGGVVVGPLSGTTYGPERYSIAPDPRPPGGASGWVTTRCTPPPGVYCLFFAVVDMLSPGVPSALLINNIHVNQA